DKLPRGAAYRTGAFVMKFRMLAVLALVAGISAVCSLPAAAAQIIYTLTGEASGTADLGGGPFAFDSQSVTLTITCSTPATDVAGVVWAVSTSSATVSGAISGNIPLPSTAILAVLQAAPFAGFGDFTNPDFIPFLNFGAPELAGHDGAHN